MTHNFHLKVYVGPTQVHELAQRFRDAGITVTVEGTESIHCVVVPELPFQTDQRIVAAAKLRMMLSSAHECTFGITYRDILLLRVEAAA